MKVTANGIDIQVREAGAGERVLVFLHFWGGSSLTWSTVMKELAKEYRCVALDSRGCGASDAPPIGYRIKDLADDTQAVIAALKLKNYVLVGHSMGGKTAQVLAARRPSGLRGLALVASSPATFLRIEARRRGQMRAAYATRESVNATIDHVLTGGPISAEDRERLVVDALRLSTAARDGWIDVGTREDYSKEVANVNVPVTVIAGTRDKVDPLEVVRSQVVPRFSDPEIHILQDKGHLLPVEAPTEVVGILRRFAAKSFDATFAPPPHA